MAKVRIITGELSGLRLTSNRDQCPCHECVHPETRQRQLDTFSIDPSIKPTKLNIQTKEKQTIQIECEYKRASSQIPV